MFSLSIIARLVKTGVGISISFALTLLMFKMIHLPASAQPGLPSITVSTTTLDTQIDTVLGVRATIRGADGATISNTLVTFTVSARGYISPEVNTTGSDGVAHSTFRAGVITGQAVMTATALGVTNSLKITITHGDPTTMTLVADDPDLVANGIATTTLRAKVIDIAGNAAENEMITFASSGGTVSHSITSTDKDGEASTVFQSGEIAGTAVVTAVVASSITQTLTISLRAGDVHTISLAVAPIALIANGSMTATVTATVTDDNANPVKDVSVTFSSTLGMVSPPFVLSTTAEGTASTTFTAGVRAGTAIVTATVGHQSAETRVELRPGAVAQMSLSVTPTTVIVGRNSQVRVNLIDANDNPVPHQPITVSIDPPELGMFTSSQAERNADILVLNSNTEGVGLAEFRSQRVGDGSIAAAVAVTSESVAIKVMTATVMLPLVVRQEPPDPFIQLVNGNFNDGRNVGWREIHVQGPDTDELIIPCTTISDLIVRAGCYDKMAWLGGRTTAQEVALRQTIALPRQYPLSLKFSYFTASNGPACDSNHIGVLKVDGVEQQPTFSMCQSLDTNAWRTVVYPLNSYTGTRTIEFYLLSGAGQRDNFWIEDVCLCNESNNSVAQQQGAPSCSSPCPSGRPASSRENTEDDLEGIGSKSDGVSAVQSVGLTVISSEVARDDGTP